MMKRLLNKLKTSSAGNSKSYKDGKRLGMKGTCKCEPTACKCGRKRQQQQQQQQQQLKLLLSQLRRRDNLSSVILF
ncbi:uncharacterized protein LOC117588163 isoform X2 [Drosophila guanche]|uniref:Uncharacterized protein n=1 Tax=Drosophila guanche TaxID=7266 RepID=A0A3B0JY34_DROGU|nr:uncharacterized protein LOC117588163 isoform X2 [Drosophila guanche]SPP85973.1 Hypothetical predicted protein [Drosophila guanche]